MVFSICPARSLYNTEKKSRLIDQKTKGELTPISSFDTHLAERSKDLCSNKLVLKKKRKQQNTELMLEEQLNFMFPPYK